MKLAVEFKEGFCCRYDGSDQDDFLAAASAGSTGQFIKDRFCQQRPANNYTEISKPDISQAVEYSGQDIMMILRSGTGWGSEEEKVRVNMPKEYINGSRGNREAPRTLGKFGDVEQRKENPVGQELSDNAMGIYIPQDKSEREYYNPFLMDDRASEGRNARGQYAATSQGAVAYKNISSSWVRTIYLIQD